MCFGPWILFQMVFASISSTRFPWQALLYVFDAIHRCKKLEGLGLNVLHG